MTNSQEGPQHQARFVAVDIDRAFRGDPEDRHSSDPAVREGALLYQELVARAARKRRAREEADRELAATPHPHLLNVDSPLLAGLGGDDCQSLRQTLGAARLRCQTCLDDALDRIVHLPAAMLTLIDMVYAIYREHMFVLVNGLEVQGLDGHRRGMLGSVMSRADRAVRAPTLAAIEPADRRDFAVACAHLYVDAPDREGLDWLLEVDQVSWNLP